MPATYPFKFSRTGSPRMHPEYTGIIKELETPGSVTSLNTGN